jgi:hypothetical protein
MRFARPWPKIVSRQAVPERSPVRGCTSRLSRRASSASATASRWECRQSRRQADVNQFIPQTRYMLRRDRQASSNLHKLQLKNWPIQLFGCFFTAFSILHICNSLNLHSEASSTPTKGSASNALTSLAGPTVYPHDGCCCPCYEHRDLPSRMPPMTPSSVKCTRSALLGRRETTPTSLRWATKSAPIAWRAEPRTRLPQTSTPLWARKVLRSQMSRPW